jgi:hypothetical protein
MKTEICISRRFGKRRKKCSKQKRQKVQELKSIKYVFIIEYIEHGKCLEKMYFFTFDPYNTSMTKLIIYCTVINYLKSAK